MSKVQFYYFSLCHFCKQPSPDLKKCNKCKILHYCSREHQAQDWPNHRTLCEVMSRNSRFIVLPPGSNANDLQHFKHLNGLVWQCELTRELQLFEHHMWMFPKLCAHCYTSEVSLICDNCSSVTYCSEEHRKAHSETHEKYCTKLKLCLKINQHCFNTDKEYDWVHFTINREVKVLPENMEAVLDMMEFAKFDKTKDDISLVLLSEYFCPIVNVVHALEKSEFIANRQGKNTKLVIHVVGPRREDYKSWLPLLEFLSHWIFNLKMAKIYMISADIKGEQKFSLNMMCDECTKKKFVGTFIMMEGVYHKTVQLIPRPDLVVGFDNALNEFSDDNNRWKDSVLKLLRFKGTPLLLTAYTESDLQTNMSQYNFNHITFYVPPGVNPYRSLRPCRYSSSETEGAVVYQHNFATIITKRQTT
jgi:hypothetical protein